MSKTSPEVELMETSICDKCTRLLTIAVEDFTRSRINGNNLEIELLPLDSGLPKSKTSPEVELMETLCILGFQSEPHTCVEDFTRSRINGNHFLISKSNMGSLVEDFTRSRINGNLSTGLSSVGLTSVEDFTRSRINGNLSSQD